MSLPGNNLRDNLFMTPGGAVEGVRSMPDPGMLAAMSLPPPGSPAARVDAEPVPLKKRKTIYMPGEDVPADAFVRKFADGRTEVLYRPTSEKHKAYHASNVPNLIMEGRRGTGKSHTIRWDFHLKALAYPNYRYLILRRTNRELRMSHLMPHFLETDMDKLGGKVLGLRNGNCEAHYPNGSIGLFGHCETTADIDKYLSAEFMAIGFDEIVTFEWEMITRIASSCRVPEGSGLTAIVRGGTNPIGGSAEDVYRYFIARDIQPEEDKDYNAADWGNLHIEKADNDHVDYQQYDKRFAGLSKAYQEAWRDGTWGVDGAYFTIKPEHLIAEMPHIAGPAGLTTPTKPALQWPWLHIYRVFDYGWHDPSVCVWIAVLPNGREIAFKEESWVHKTAHTVRDDIKQMSQDSGSGYPMKVITTIADPTLWDGEKEMLSCMADVFERGPNGFPMTKGRNDRVAAGFAIQEHLNTLLPDGLPKLQIVEKSCTTLVRTLKAMRVDKKNPGRIADHKADHMPIALGYFCMSNVAPTRVPVGQAASKPWEKKRGIGAARPVLGSSQVRRRTIH